MSYPSGASTKQEELTRTGDAPPFVVVTVDFAKEIGTVSWGMMLLNDLQYVRLENKGVLLWWMIMGLRRMLSLDELARTKHMRGEWDPTTATSSRRSKKA
ncbi:unnamed protein product [Dovyalis caffra]|uniref:Uncharacterized protein n=1 Tax=Dovyalis caffra TaxID=77055 RepID=A0AAV1QYS2_9ROSI|nr:unnamed protein product [Dovyalis caffra]